MKITYPDYNNSIANLACSILKHFGADCPDNGTLPAADELLKKDYKNVVVILLDAMGKTIMEKNLEQDGFFRKHLVTTYSSVFPPTTVAATTAINSGLFPSQSGWLGWDCYFKAIDKNVTVFTNTESGTEQPAADFNVAWKYIPYYSVNERIKNAGGQAYQVAPFLEPFPQTFEAICHRVWELCCQDGKKYIYAYWNEPDTTMHRKGCYAPISKDIARALEKSVETLCGQLPDTLVIVTADHGHMDSEGAVITEYPKIMECLVRMPSIEPRALNLFVKKGFEAQLKEEFEKAFGDKFLLLPKEEVKERELFGRGAEHSMFDEMLGDYLAVAVADLSIYNTAEEKEKFIGAHAGLTEDEMLIPLIAVEASKCSGNQSSKMLC